MPEPKIRPKRKTRTKRDSDLSITEENDQEQAEISQPKVKKQREKRVIPVKELFLDPKKCKNPEIFEVAKKCEKILLKLRSHANGSHFYNSSDHPNIKEVEKKVKEFSFQNFFFFAIEVRKVWKSHFVNIKSPETYQKALDICQYFEQIVTEDEGLNIDYEKNNKSTQPAQIHQKENGKPKQGKSRQAKVPQKVAAQPTKKEEKIVEPKSIQESEKKKVNTKAPIVPQEKPMSNNEKNILGNHIRMLTQQQMREMIHIVRDQNSNDSNSKYFEFDIDTLSAKKLRDLEVYVKECMVTNQRLKEASRAQFSQQEQAPINNVKPANIKHAIKPKQTEAQPFAPGFHPRPIAVHKFTPTKPEETSDKQSSDSKSQEEEEEEENSDNASSFNVKNGS